MKFIVLFAVLFSFISVAQARCSKPVKCTWISKAPGHEQNVGEICIPLVEKNEYGSIYTHTLNAGEFTISVVKRKAQPGVVEMVLIGDRGAEIVGEGFEIAYSEGLIAARRAIDKRETRDFSFTHKSGIFESIYNCKL